MRCARCNGEFDYPDDFPVPLYAICRTCHALQNQKVSLWEKIKTFFDQWT